MQQLVTANDIVIYEKICAKIQKLDKSIRFVGIVTDMGKMIAGGAKKGIKLLVDQKDQEMLFMEVALRIRMRHEFNLKLGPVNFTISNRKNVVLMSIPLMNNKLLYLSARKGFDLAKTPIKIVRILRRAKLFE